VTAPRTAPAPDALAGILAPDLIAIIAHLAAGSELPAGQAPGVVSVRLSGDPAGIDAAVAALAAVFEVLNRTGPRPNRRDPGQRVYLTIRTTPPGADRAGLSA
jgi:hypothetical protein